MTSATATREAPPAPRLWAPAAASIARTAGWWGLLLLPGALTVFLSFNSGGRGPEATGIVLAVLALVVMGHAVVAREPFAGLSLPLLIGGGALLLFAGWTWLSSGWSEAPARSLLEFQRVAAYLLALALYGSFLRRHGGISLVLKGVAAGIAIVCVAALATRLYPDLYGATSSLAKQRLSYPISYWNSLGLLAGIGLVLLLHLACDERGKVLTRALGAAGVPAAALTVYFTFSRGATVAVAIGVLAYLVLGRPRGAITGLLATVPTTLAALKAGYGADLLATVDNTSSAAAEQGHHVAGVLLFCCASAGIARLALSPVDAQLRRFSLSGKAREASRIGAVVLALTGLVVLVAADVPDRVENEWNEFTDRPQVTGDARTRLRSTSLGSRRDHWDVALASYRDDHLKGTGAGTFETEWLRSRSSATPVKDAHSLYYEVLSELGLVGFLLMASAFAAILVGLALRARGPRRPLYGAVLAVAVMWMAHAGVDWDWELLGVSLWLFALVGAALARHQPRDGWGVEGRWAARGIVAVACLVIAIGAVRTVVSESALDDSISAFSAGDCASARSPAVSSLNALDIRPQPLAILAYCDGEKGRSARAIETMETAARLDPGHWRYRYGLAILRARAGQNPRPDLKAARRLNPLGETATTGVVAELARAERKDWPSLAKLAPTPID